MRGPSTHEGAEAFLASAERLAHAGPALLGRMLRAGDYADLFLEASTHTAATLVAGRAPAWREASQHMEGLGARILQGHRQTIASTPDADPASWEAAVIRATQSLPQVSVAAPRPALQTLVTAPLALPADAPESLAPLEIRALLEAYVDAAFAADAGVTRVEADFRSYTRRTALASSEGAFYAQAATRIEVRIGVTLTPAGPAPGFSLRGSCAGFGPIFLERPELLAREAVDHARVQRDARSAPAGPCPVVVAGGWGGVVLHEAIGHALEADLAGDGALAGPRPVGVRLAPPVVTLVDDPTVSNRRGSARFDDEGAPTARIVLIDAGVRRAVLADRTSAVRWGVPATASGRRQDYRFAPQTRMSNLCLLPGETPPEDLFDGITRGLFIRRPGGGRYDPRSGAFSVDLVEAYTIEHGRVTGPVRGGRLAGTGPAMLQGIRGVGDAMEWDTGHGYCEKNGQVVPIGTAMPAIRIDTLFLEPAS